MKYEAIPVKTRYIKPNEGFEVIIRRAGPLLKNNDFLVISETPIAIAQGRIYDILKYKPSLSAIFLAEIWSKFLWGYFLGPIFRIKSRTIKNLRKLPPEARNLKEFILRHYGWLHALKPSSEAGVDLSNVPDTYVAPLPKNPKNVAKYISKEILERWNKKVTVVIVDTDATYKVFGKLITSLPIAVRGIKSNLGFLAYLLGRFGKKIGPTPIASSKELPVTKLIKISKIAEKIQEKFNTFETVYDMEEFFGREDVDIKMLNTIKHVPAVIIRKVNERC